MGDLEGATGGIEDLKGTHIAVRPNPLGWQIHLETKLHRDALDGESESKQPATETEKGMPKCAHRNCMVAFVSAESKPHQALMRTTHTHWLLSLTAPIYQPAKFRFAKEQSLFSTCSFSSPRDIKT